MNEYTPEPWRWRSTDARNITEEVGWVAIPREDYRRLQSGLKGVNPDAVQDMLDMLKTIENDAGQVPEWLWDRIRAVIEKVEGRTT